jgi:hypothetical protein
LNRLDPLENMEENKNSLVRTPFNSLVAGF